MLRALTASLCATLLGLQPAPAHSAGAGTTNAGTPAANSPQLNTANTWRAHQIIGLNKLGVVSPRVGVGLQLVGPEAGENSIVDAFSYNGYGNYITERYDYSSGFRPVGAGEIVGGYLGAAFDGTGDPTDAGVLFHTTELQTPAHNGMDLRLTYTPNASTALTTGLSVSPHGAGGVTIGDESLHGAIPDLGNGTIDAADSITTQNHFRTIGPRPAVSGCGAGASVLAGTDVAGQVATGGPVNACTVTFAKTYGTPPVCIVQVYNSASPTAYVTRFSATSFSVGFSSPLNGAFFYMCQGIS